MKTLMKFGAVLALAFASGAASADYIYAIVDDVYYADDTSTHPTFDYLTVKGKVDSDYNILSLYLADSSVSTTQFPSDGASSSSGAPTDGFYVGLADDTTYSSFLFELFNTGSEDVVGYQEFSWSDVASYVFGSNADRASASPLVVSQVVPEPTSGLLLLFGGALLALRRRKLNG